MDRRTFLLGTAAIPATRLLPEVPFTGLPEPAVDPHDEAYWHALRWHFPIPKGDAYCNTATLGVSPKSVLHAMHDHMLQLEQGLSSFNYRSGKRLPLAGYQDEPELRARVADWMGCSREEVALTRNATMGMNFIAMGLLLQKADEVIMTDQEHPGGRCGYDLRAKRDGIKIVEVPLALPPSDPDAITKSFVDAVNERTRVLAIPHITSALGVILPVKRIIEGARKKNDRLFVVLDGAQALGHVPVNVRDFDCDAYFSSPHKWMLAPKGTGVLYVRKDKNERVWTTIASGEWDFRDDVGRRFSQMGTGNQSLHEGFKAALDFLDRIGREALHTRIRALGERLRAGLREIDGVTIQSSTHADLAAGITTYGIRGWKGQAINVHMYETDRIMPRAVQADFVRQSFHVYTTFDDVDRTLSRVRKLVASPPSK